MATWPFKDPQNVAVFTEKRIVFEGERIVHVSHDAEDGAWQFHTSSSTPPVESDAAVISLRELLRIDPSVAELADLPLGWRAWRDGDGSRWHRAMK